MVSRKPTTSKRGIGDPLDYFPYEVWVKCISFAVYNEPCGPLPLLLVSPRWEKALIETPEAWTFIVIDDGEDLMARIATFLCLSQNHLVDLRFIFPAEAWLQSMSILLESSYKIRAMTLSSKVRDPPPFNTLPFFRSLDPEDKYFYPELEEIASDLVSPNLDQPQQIPATFISACPKLDSISGIQSNFRLHTAPIKKYFVTLGGNMDETELARAVRGITSLRLLEGSENQDNTGSILFKECASNLEDLHLDTFYYGFGGTFLNAFYPNIRNLLVSLPTNASTQLVSCLYLFPNLKHLDLKVTYSQNTTIYSELTGSEMPRLQTFVLKERGYGGSCILGNIIQTLADNQALEQVDTIAIYFHDAHGITTTALDALLRASKSVMSLKLDTMYQVEEGIQNSVFDLPNLKTLSIRSVGPLRLIDAPNLETLEFPYSPYPKAASELERFGDKISTLAIDPSTFSAMFSRLQSLRPDEVPFPALSWMRWPLNAGYEPAFQTTLISALTTVDFAASTQYANSEICTLDYFCINLLRYPEACPKLECIKSADFPCWDLLFAVLFQRSVDLKVRSIRVLGFPSMPVNALVKILVAFLDYEHPKPFGDAIETAIQKRFAQLHSTVCLPCIAGGYTRCVKSTPARAEPEHSDQEGEEEEDTKGKKKAEPDPTNDLDFLILPKVKSQGPNDRLDHNWEWWETRLEKRFQAGSMGSCSKCLRHLNHFGPVSITRHTLS